MLQNIQTRLNARYRLLSAVSHHDATVARDANQNLYNRQKIRVPFENRGARYPTPTDISTFANAFPVPIETLDIFEDEPFERFVATALISLFLERYTQGSESGDWGEGLFTGMSAYRRLTDRIELAAPRARTLKEFWSLLLTDMQVGPVGNPEKLFKVLAVPNGIHHEVLYQFQKHALLIVEMARYWKYQEKCADPEYAKKAKTQQTTGQTTVLEFPVSTDVSEATEAVSLAVPHHSGNDIRHDIRYASMIHLFRCLGFTLESRLPVSLKALLENGGNIAKGKSAPSTAYSLAQTIRATYPSLGLLSGCTESFLLGDANLHAVCPFWYGSENNAALEALFGVTAEHSILDLLDDYTLHRHSGRTHDVSPMPYSFETLQPGADLYVQFRFSPWTTALEFGAFLCAFQTFQEIDGTVGGQSAKGFGTVECELLNLQELEGPLKADYEHYLQNNAIDLQEGLLTGKLGTDTVVCSS